MLENGSKIRIFIVAKLHLFYCSEGVVEKEKKVRMQSNCDEADLNTFDALFK
jgi:hypothetical protein